MKKLFSYGIGIAFMLFSTFQLLPAQIIPSLKWEVTHHENAKEISNNWIPAEVPGAVQLDYAKSNNWPPFYYAENWKDYRWMEDSFWSYRAEFKSPILKNNQQLWFVSKGIDYKFEILINGELITFQEGMFTPVRENLTPYLKPDNEIMVTIYPAPKIPGLSDSRDQAAQSAKPAVSYGWDWHPRLVPLGIWDETFLEIKSEIALFDVLVNYRLIDDLKTARINISPIGENLIGSGYKWQLINPEGKVAITKEGVISDSVITGITFSNPSLWWPHDHGAQPLYTSRFSIINSKGDVQESFVRKIGFRKVQLVMNPGTWDEPQGMPRARSHPPITIEINGRQIFSKGTNWVNPEIFPGTITPDRYNELLERALEANFNLLRTWGGAIVNKESFYELCDEKGILVWTEFPLACNNYLGTDEYLAVLRQESTSIIKRISQHPSNAFWSGGNELFNSWSRMTDQSAALRLLNSQCFLLDPETPFISTAPLAGMGHGHYVFRDFNTHEEVYQWMPLSRFTAYSEFGMPSPSSVDILKMIIPKDELFPPKTGTSWESHHAFNAWGADTWLQLELLVDYFGELKNLEDMVANGQWLQSEGYKCIYEEARRQKPYCSMALNWCYNEPWPTAANNNLISYPNIPKPAFYAVSQSCRPVIASARIPKFRWQEGETFYADLYMLNDTYAKLKGGKMVVKIIAGNYEKVVAGWDFPESTENENIVGPTIRLILPGMESDRFTLMLEVDGKPEWNSSYTLQYKAHTINTQTGPPVMNQ